MNSFLPLEKKPFFFLPCAEQSVFVELSGGTGAGGGQWTSTAAGVTAGPGAGLQSDGRPTGAAGLAGTGLAGTSVRSVGSGRGGPVWECKDTSAVEHPGCCVSVEDVTVTFRRKLSVRMTKNKNTTS